VQLGAFRLLYRHACLARRGPNACVPVVNKYLTQVHVQIVVHVLLWLLLVMLSGLFCNDYWGASRSLGLFKTPPNTLLT
jgi:hypothetical protein